MDTRFLFLHLAHPHEALNDLAALCARRPEEHRWVSPDACGKLGGVQPDVVVVHLMEAPFPELLARWPEAAVVWAAWGKDYYGRFPELAEGLLLPRTRAMALRIGKPTAFFPRFPHWLRSLRTLRIESEEAWLSRVGYVSSFLQEAFPAKHRLPQAVRFIPHLYGQIDVAKWEHLRIESTARGVVIGPSAELTSNLPDALVWLADKAPGVPVRAALAYGSPRIRRRVQSAGTRLFTNDWEPLTELTDLPEFLRWLTRSHCLVLFSIRMQGIRTLLYALWVGMRVVLHPKNPALVVLRNRGFVVFDSEGISGRDLALPLPHPDQETNRLLVKRHADPKRIHEGLDQILRDRKRPPTP